MLCSSARAESHLVKDELGDQCVPGDLGAALFAGPAAQAHVRWHTAGWRRNTLDPGRAADFLRRSLLCGRSCAVLLCGEPERARSRACRREGGNAVGGSRGHGRPTAFLFLRYSE